MWQKHLECTCVGMSWCVMAELRCHACGTAVMPNSIYCSTCGRLLNQPRIPRWRGIVTIMRLFVMIWLAGWIMRMTLPVAVRIIPACGGTPSTIAVIPRTLGLIHAQQGLVDDQAFLQAGDCDSVVPAWYRITTNQAVFFAVAQRDPHTWAGWLVATSETQLASVTQIGVHWLREAVGVAVNGVQHVVDKCTVWSCHW